MGVRMSKQMLNLCKIYVKYNCDDKICYLMLRYTNKDCKKFYKEKINYATKNQNSLYLPWKGRKKEE